MRLVPHIWRETHIWREMPAFSRCSWRREQPYPHAMGSEGMEPPSCPPHGVTTTPGGEILADLEQVGCRCAPPNVVINGVG